MLKERAERRSALGLVALLFAAALASGFLSRGADSAHVDAPPLHNIRVSSPAESVTVESQSASPSLQAVRGVVGVPLEPPPSPGPSPEAQLAEQLGLRPPSGKDAVVELIERFSASELRLFAELQRRTQKRPSAAVVRWVERKKAGATVEELKSQVDEVLAGTCSCVRRCCVGSSRRRRSRLPRLPVSARKDRLYSRSLPLARFSVDGPPAERAFRERGGRAGRTYSP